MLSGNRRVVVLHDPPPSWSLYNDEGTDLLRPLLSVATGQRNGAEFADHCADSHVGGGEADVHTLDSVRCAREKTSMHRPNRGKGCLLTSVLAAKWIDVVPIVSGVVRRVIKALVERIVEGLDGLANSPFVFSDHRSCSH